MSDPFSVAGSAVGVISLGIAVAQGLIDYYQSYQGQNAAVARMLAKIQRLATVLGQIEENLKLRPDDDDDAAQQHHGAIPQSVADCIEDCSESLEDLKQQLDKFKGLSSNLTVQEKMRRGVRRLQYPFQEKTLQKMDIDIDDCLGQLGTAMASLQQADTSNLRVDLRDVQSIVRQVRSTQISSEIRQWLNAPDASSDLHEASKKRHPGTGSWFLEGGVFQNWVNTPNSTCWLVGFAGCGKSVLSSTVIQHVFGLRVKQAGTAVAFFFCTFKDHGKQSASAMLRAVVLQLLGQIDAAEPNPVSKLHQTLGGRSPSDQDLTECLHELVGCFKNVFIVIDAVDESPRDEHRQSLLTTLFSIMDWSEPGLRVMLTSRDEPDIRLSIDAVAHEEVHLSNSAVGKDIASFVSTQLRCRPSLRKWAAHHCAIEAALAEKARGVFRWVECQLQMLSTCPANAYVLNDTLESLPPTLNKTYEQMIASIPATLRKYTKQALMLLCCARRPLFAEELLDGIAVDLGEDGHIAAYDSKRRFEDHHAILQLCPGLVELESDVDFPYLPVSVRLAHFSVREYLESQQCRESPLASPFAVHRREADTQIARIGLALLESSHDRGAHTRLAWDRLYTDVFLRTRIVPGNHTARTPEYYRDFWVEHLKHGAQKEQADEEVLGMVARQFHRVSGVRLWPASWYELLKLAGEMQSRRDGQSKDWSMSLLSLASSQTNGPMNETASAVNAIVQSTPEHAESYGFPLVAPSALDPKDTIMTSLEAAVESRTKERFGESSTVYVRFLRALELLRLLLGTRPDTSITDNRARTPLFLLIGDYCPETLHYAKYAKPIRKIDVVARGRVIT